MHRFLIFALGGLLGVIGGFAVGIFVYPYIFLADIVANEQVANVAEKNLVASGQFIHANPSDPVHYGKGGVRVFDDVVHIGADFEVGPGPKFHVYLVPDAPVTPDTAVNRTMYVDLGRLRAFKGSQVFDIPAGTDLKQFKSVVIWCEQFNVLISPAALNFKGT
ncbi:MAG: DM13 domain-containing protein [Magnetovibrio sp.]|nr:DM13 domain-containing protein [Magnetovibrio sp.]